MLLRLSVPHSLGPIARESSAEVFLRSQNFSFSLLSLFFIHLFCVGVSFKHDEIVSPATLSARPSFELSERACAILTERTSLRPHDLQHGVSGRVKQRKGYSKFMAPHKIRRLAEH